MQLPWVITIDGPAGSGKSTVGRLLAQCLDYTFFDSGVMYRALTVVALRRGIPMNNRSALIDLAYTTAMEIYPSHSLDDGRYVTILANGEDVTNVLNTPQVSGHVSKVASVPEVRVEIVRQQRAIGLRGSVVMVGRDSGTIIMPEAPLKLYLQASLKERARRRTLEYQALGHHITMAEVHRELGARDARDAPVLVPAPDAHILESDTCSPADIVTTILKIIISKQPLPTRVEQRDEVLP